MLDVFSPDEPGDGPVLGGHDGRPVRLPRDQAGRQWGRFGWSFRWSARRQLFFLPGFVVKVPMTLGGGRVMRSEVDRSQAASRHPLWRDTVLEAWSLAGLGTISRRCAPVRLEDHGAIASLLEAKLERALGFRTAPVPRLLEQSTLWQALPREERRRLALRLRGARLPRSSMHGDVHLFNFVREAGDYRLLDWECFDERGSFVYDYLDFQINVAQLNRDQHWHRLLAGLDAAAPVFKKAAARTGAAPQALLFYYVCTKLDVLISRALVRRGGWEAAARGAARDPARHRRQRRPAADRLSLGALRANTRDTSIIT